MNFTLHKGILAEMEAKPGQEAALKQLLTDALALAQAEPETTVWFSFQSGPNTFGIFDAFTNEAGREAHMNGKIPAALMARAETLLAKPPRIDKIEILASKF
jgi:quinol monooxygenase YgiN